MGCEKHYRHREFFPNATAYRCTNIARDYDERLDITAMPFADESQNAFVCVPVLAHVPNLFAAMAEIDRTLKPAGALLLVVPFAFPRCDAADYWRLARNAYDYLLPNYEIRAFAHLGGVLSSAVDNLMRPMGKWTPRYAVYKILALLISLFGTFETIDGRPLGYGVYAVKTNSPRV